MRWLMFSASMRTLTASLLTDLAARASCALAFSSALAGSWSVLSSVFEDLSVSGLESSADFSSSLSGARGDGWSLRRTIRYALRVIGRLMLDRSSQPVVGPTSVLAVKNRYC